MIAVEGTPYEDSDTDSECYPLTMVQSSQQLIDAERSVVEFRAVGNGVDIEFQDEGQQPMRNAIARVPSIISKNDLELRKAIRKIDLPTVKKLLDEGSSPTRRIKGNTPLHNCFSNKYYSWEMFYDDDYMRAVQNCRKRQMKIMEILLEKINKMSNKTSILNYPDTSGNTPLHYAIQDGHLEAVQALIAAGAKVDCLNNNQKTALHLAAGQKDHEILNYLVDKFPDIKYSADIDGQYPLQCAVTNDNVESVKIILEIFGAATLDKVDKKGSTVWHTIAEENSVNIARYLLNLNSIDKDNIKKLDINKMTPVHIAASKGYEEMTMLLLCKGEGYLSVKDEKTTVIELIISEFIDPKSFLEDLFSKWIRKGFSSHEAVVNFKRLTDYRGLSQITMIDKLVRCDHGALLKHPFIESLIYFKWKCISPVIYLMLTFYMIFLIVFNVFVVYTFAKIDNVRDMDTEIVNAGAHMTDMSCGWPYWTLFGLVYWSIGVLLSLECIWLFVEKSNYLKRRESWMGLVVLALAGAVPPAVGCAPHAPLPWQRHLACLAVLLTWLQALLLMAQNPDWTYYYAFERAVKKILKISVTAICLLFGFAICFLVQYQSQPPFDGLGAAVTKTVMMMVSEFDYEHLMEVSNQTLSNTPTPAQFKASQIIIKILFVIFIILVAITLMNFMVGIAVDDIKKLSKSGEIRRLQEQVEILSILEGLGDTVFGKCWVRLTHIRRQNKMTRNLTAPGSKWNVYVGGKYDDIKVSQTFTSRLHKSIYKIAKKKYRDKLNELYEALLGKPQELISHNDRTKTYHITLKARIKAIEDANADMKKSLNAIIKNVGDILRCVEKRDKVCSDV